MMVGQADGGSSGVAVGRVATSWGEVSVSVRDGRLIGVDLPAGGAGTVLGAGVPPKAVNSGDRAALERWLGELEAYFRGEKLAWKAEEIPLDGLGLGAFDRAVYGTLLTVPPAVTVSYGTLAEMAGFPRAARAVGNAMATNPIPIVIPCHRVIRSDGALGNYGNDPVWKERLLAHEREHAGGGAAGR